MKSFLLDALLWVYFVNFIFIINQLIYSAYRNDWNLKGKLSKYGINGHLILCFGFLFIFQYGLLEIFKGTVLGLTFSFCLGQSGIMNFIFYIKNIRKDRKELNTPLSLFLFITTFILSIILVTIWILLIIY